jgi:cysteine desulfurase
MVYFDHNATAPICPELKAKVPEWLEYWGNPSSIHYAGRGPKALLREARQRVAQFLGVDALELIFTSGGSEANNLALKGLVPFHPVNGRDRILISSVEHPSVTKTAMALGERGYKLEVIPVGRGGEIDWPAYRALVGPRTALVSCMLANNETGNIFPIAEMAQSAHESGALFHCDAVQALGKIPLNLRELGVDAATVSGHKFYALKGCGALYVRKGLNINSLIHGGPQERGRRAGTENVLSAASLGFMCRQPERVMERAEKVRTLRDHLEARVLSEISNVRINGAGSPRLPNTSHMTLTGVDGETLLINLDVEGFAVSTGAACSSGSPEPSPALLAMGHSRTEAQSSLRLSLGWENTREEVDVFVDVLKSVVTRLRSFKHGESFVYGL